MLTIAIIGGGASGICAAIAAKSLSILLRATLRISYLPFQQPQKARDRLRRS